MLHNPILQPPQQVRFHSFHPRCCSGFKFPGAPEIDLHSDRTISKAVDGLEAAYG